MPASGHLQWFDIDDFTSGLWDEIDGSQLLAPPKAFITLSDYEPRQAGGLRAFYKGTSLATTGLDNASTEIPMAFFARTGAGSAAGFDQYLLTMGTDFKVRFYRWDESQSETQWTRRKLGTAGTSASFNYSSIVEFQRISDSAILILECVRQANGGTQGTWEWNNANTITQLQANPNGPLVVSQGRVLMADGAAIHYSDTGKDTFTNYNNQVLTVAPSQAGNGIGMLAEQAPADLLVGLEMGPWYEINGDISSTATPVRAMGDDHHQRVHIQDPCRVPGGLAFIEPGGRIYITDGRNFQSISDPITRFAVNFGNANAVGPGRLGYQNDYLFAPGGYVYDFRTKAWFKSTLMPTVAYIFGTGGGRTFLTNGDSPALLAYHRIFEGGDNTVTRCSTGIIQTVPYADKNGRNIDIREVQVFAQAYTASDFKVELVDETGSTVATRWGTIPAARREMVKFQFPSTKSEYLSVKLTPRALNGTSEAPTIERIRVGFGINNLIT